MIKQKSAHGPCSWLGRERFLEFSQVSPFLRNRRGGAEAPPHPAGSDATLRVACYFLYFPGGGDCGLACCCGWACCCWLCLSPLLLLWLSMLLLRLRLSPLLLLWLSMLLLRLRLSPLLLLWLGMLLLRLRLSPLLLLWLGMLLLRLRLSLLLRLWLGMLLLRLLPEPLLLAGQRCEQESPERSVCLPRWASSLQIRPDARD